MKADYGGSHTPKELRDRWQTPLPLFTALDAEFGFYLDAAADRNNALCTHYLTEKDNSLNCDWESYGAIFCNPPYSEIQPWINKAAEQCKKQLQPIVMLIPSDTSVGWFKSALETADEVRLIIGRISFIKAETDKTKNGNTKGSMLLIWRPYINPRKIINTINRDELMNIGNQILNEWKIA
ncbi:phage N-6-adenine-methyltransferase [Providencia huaxiensis]|uniref:phage N-6-adenine-methyltransferase n=1 Tax=Providencia huaxiensis TaxID=2027290 RepID=UPI0034E4246F